MITFQEARQIAETELSKHQFADNDSLIIIDEATIEKEYAWIFPYISKRFWKTKDIYNAIAGNGPLFISKVDGTVSTYRTGLSIEGMIDEYEEENKIWNLSLADNIFAHTNKAFAFRQVLGLTIAQFADYKKNNKEVFESGSRTRLLEIQKQLSFKSIATHLKQRLLTESAKIDK